ncbi:MAG: hypothetical protein NWF09_07505 [Candidatus Bathyarchaeota archaeon]|nr:hypothetical protein [Candidatus Bathyarchaeota archaeon]
MEKCPKCEKCGEKLKKIFVEKQGEYLYWTKHGYKEDDAQVTVTFFCGSCNEPVGGWRSNGEDWGFIP